MKQDGLKEQLANPRIYCFATKKFLQMKLNRCRGKRKTPSKNAMCDIIVKRILFQCRQYTCMKPNIVVFAQNVRLPCIQWIRYVQRQSMLRSFHRLILIESAFLLRANCFSFFESYVQMTYQNGSGQVKNLLCLERKKKTWE